jgi:putative photosynthetic complex assembly protein
VIGLDKVSDPFAGRPFPRGPLIGAAAMIVLALAAAGWGRLTGVHRADTAAVLASRDLRFDDRPGGGIAIYDIRSSRPIDVVPPGTNGFLRAALRGLARDRKRGGGSETAPFRLAALADGRLTLKDLVTGDRVDLEAFGATNAGAFARLLTAGRQRP